MDEAQPNEPISEPKPNVGTILKESVADAWRLLGETREQKSISNMKQAVLGATLATAIAIVIALVAVSHLDAPLTLASWAMGFAVPLLVIAFLFSTVEFGPEFPVFLANILRFSSFVVSEGLGGLAVLVGFFCLLWHLSPWATFAAGVGLLLALLAPSLVMLVILVRLAVIYREYKTRGEPIGGEALVRKSRFVSLFLEDLNEPPKAA